MNPDIQKIIDFIREGATAAAGPAKWGFEQVCAYKATEALFSLVCISVVFLICLVVFAVAIWRYLNPKSRTKRFVGTWFNAPSHLEYHWSGCSRDELKTIDYETTDNEAWGIAAAVSGMLVALFLIGIISVGPSLSATIKNPAGAVLNSFVSR